MGREVSKFGLLTMSVGGMIGWGAFMQPGLKFIPSGLLNTMIGMFLGLMMVGVIASCYGIILEKSPDSKGGEYSYSKLIFSRKHNFIVGWFLLIVFIGIAALNTTSFALVVKNAVFPDMDFITLYTVAGAPVTLGEVVISIIIISIFSIFMVRGVKAVVTIQNIVTTALLIIVGILFFTTFPGMEIADTPLAEHMRGENISRGGITSILVITPWAYYGVSSIPKVAGDAKLPYKKVILITLLSLICGYVIYQMLLLLTASIYSQKELLGYSGWATGEAIKKLYGNSGLLVITAGLSFAIFSGVNSFYMGAIRVMESMSRDGLLPPLFMEKHSRYATPYKAIFFILIMIWGAPFFGRNVLSWIVDMSALGGSVVFLYTSLTAYKISRSVERVIGAVAVIFSSIFVLLLITPGSPGVLSLESVAALLIWGALGAGFYPENITKVKSVLPRVLCKKKPEVEMLKSK